MPKMGIRMNWSNIDQFDEYKVELMAKDLQEIRGEVNRIFKKENNGQEIGIEVTSGWRCLMWELHKKRSGQSRHRIDGVDWRPSNVSPELSDKILWWAFKRWSPRVAGWKGGFAMAEPDRSSPNKKDHKAGFIHTDRRPGIARWSY